MIGGASVEDTLTLWASSLRDAKQRICPLFTQERVAASAGQFLDGLLGNEPRKTGWMRAEAAGDPGPWRQQAILGRGQWAADALRDIVREYALETLALSQTCPLDEQADQIRHSGSEDFKLLGERWCRIVGVPRLSFAHHVNHFDTRQDRRGAGG